MTPAERPPLLLLVRLNTNLNPPSLRAKFPLPKSRWHGKYSDLNAVVKAAWEAGCPDRMNIDYVTEEK